MVLVLRRFIEFRGAMLYRIIGPLQVKHHASHKPKKPERHKDDNWREEGNRPNHMKFCYHGKSERERNDKYTYGEDDKDSGAVTCVLYCEIRIAGFAAIGECEIAREKGPFPAFRTETLKSIFNR
jgi:hypothetical protein